MTREPELNERVGAALRALPAVHVLQQTRFASGLAQRHGAEATLVALRAVLDDARARIRSADAPSAPTETALLSAAEAWLVARDRPTLRRVINATGIVLHTGLGRAPLAAEALEAIGEAARGYCNLEFDLETGARGDRYTHAREILRELTGAADALVVNNNAGATLLALAALAGDGREVVISRGQLVEIGGSYRMPEVMAAAGCKMVEVGATNRTHLRDYRGAVSERTAVLLRVHASNYRIEGFATEPTIAELARVRQEFGDLKLTLVDDLGSGLIDAPARYASEGEIEHLPAWDEPTVRDSLANGADVVLFSGDKLLGGPQAGIAVGRAEVIARMRAHPMCRALRPDKLGLAALEATLRLYRDPERVLERVPTLRLLTASPAVLEARAGALAEALGAIPELARSTPTRDMSFAGGGSLPTIEFATWTVRLAARSISAGALARRLRAGDPPVIARVVRDEVVLDCRTVVDDELPLIVEVVGGATGLAARSGE